MRGSRSCSTSGHRRPDRSRLLPQRPPGAAGRRRGELPLGRLRGHPGRPPRRSRPDLRRRARTLPRPAVSASSSRAIWVPAGCARWNRPSTPSTATRAAPGAVAAADRLRAPPGRFTPYRPRTSAADHRAERPRRRSSPPTTPTSRAVAAPQSAFEASLGDLSEDVRRRFYCDNFLDLIMGTASRPRRRPRRHCPRAGSGAAPPEAASRPLEEAGGRGANPTSLRTQEPESASANPCHCPVVSCLIVAPGGAGADPFPPPAGTGWWRDV